MTDDPLNNIDDSDEQDQADEPAEPNAVGKAVGRFAAGIRAGKEEVARAEETAVDSVAEFGGRTVGAAPIVIIRLIASFLGSIAGGALSKFPKRVSVYQKMIKLGYKGMYKKTGAHVVTNTIYGDGEMVAQPATLDSETSKLETANGEEWTVANGLEPVRIGDAPVVTGVADQHELVDHVGARISEAVDLSPQRYQAVEDGINGSRPVDPKGSTAANGHSGAVADGGSTLLEQSSTFSDIWVDVSNPEPEHDGMIVSMQKAYELHWDQASSEEMENQETRGILAAKDPKQDKKRMIIIAAMILAAFCLGLFGPALASQLAGSASGAAGGGGNVPVMLGWL